MAETRRIKMTKKLIKDALVELLESNHLSAISVTGICERADVNRSTFYVYYDGIPQLMRELEQDALSQIPVSPTLPAGPEDELFLQLLTEFFEYVRRNGSMFSVLLRVDNVGFVERLVESVCASYSLAENDSPLARFGYAFCINGAVGLLRDWIARGFPLDNRAFASIVLRMSAQAYRACTAV